MGEIPYEGWIGVVLEVVVMFVLVPLAHTEKRAETCELTSSSTHGREFAHAGNLHLSSPLGGT